MWPVRFSSGRMTLSPSSKLSISPLVVEQPAVHALLVQLEPARQTLPQAPQLLTSVEMSSQTLLQQPLLKHWSEAEQLVPFVFLGTHVAAEQYSVVMQSASVTHNVGPQRPATQELLAHS